MWKIELPYVPGTTVYTPICNHLGRWETEECLVHHYIINSETDISVALYTARSYKYRFFSIKEIFATADAAAKYVEEKQKKVEQKK